MRRRKVRSSASLISETLHRLGRKRRRDLLFAWLTLLPDITALPVSSQRRAMGNLILDQPKSPRRKDFAASRHGRLSKAQSYTCGGRVRQAKTRPEAPQIRRNSGLKEPDDPIETVRSPAFRPVRARQPLEPLRSGARLAESVSARYQIRAFGLTIGSARMNAEIGRRRLLRHALRRHEGHRAHILRWQGRGRGLRHHRGGPDRADVTTC